MTTPTSKPNYASTYHRDGTVSLWNCLSQAWERTARPSDALLATLDDEDRVRVLLHTGAARDLAPEALMDVVADALTFNRVPWTALTACGCSAEAVAEEARSHGDRDLYRRAVAFATR